MHQTLLTICFLEKGRSCRCWLGISDLVILVDWMPLQPLALNQIVDPYETVPLDKSISLILLDVPGPLKQIIATFHDQKVRIVISDQFHGPYRWLNFLDGRDLGTWFLDYEEARESCENIDSIGEL